MEKCEKNTEKPEGKHGKASNFNEKIGKWGKLEGKTLKKWRF